MQNILFDAELSVHKFGSHLLHVPSLKNWAEAKGFHFPKTNPPIEDYKFVQVEALLVAIMRVVHSSMTPEDGFAFVQNDSKLNGNQLAQDPITAKWLIGADVHSQWRKEIAAAIENRELKLLKLGSLLPITDEDLGALISSLPQTQTSAIETLQTEAKVDIGETNARDAGQAGTEILQIKGNNKKPKIRDKGRQQMDAILTELKRLGHNPSCLPALVAGQRSAKAEVFDILDRKGFFTSPTAFENSWQTLTQRRLIAYETKTQ